MDMIIFKGMSTKMDLLESWHERKKWSGTIHVNKDTTAEPPEIQNTKGIRDPVSLKAMFLVRHRWSKWEARVHKP